MMAPLPENLVSLRDGRAWVSQHDVHGDRNFVLYNLGLHDTLTADPVDDGDLVPISVKAGSKYASETWSCGINWYFMVIPTGIALLSVHTNRGFFCTKRSWRFIELFIEAPPPRKNKKSPAKEPAK